MVTSTLEVSNSSIAALAMIGLFSPASAIVTSVSTIASSSRDSSAIGLIAISLSPAQTLDSTIGLVAAETSSSNCYASHMASVTASLSLGLPELQRAQPRVDGNESVLLQKGY